MTLDDLLGRSAATPAFLDAAARFRASGRPNERITFGAGAPAVKVERTLAKALVEYPDLAIESIEVRGRSGCESFHGELVLRAEDGARRVSFHWDCRWRAEQEGWRDWFGFPDQIRAAREFGWDCFRHWREDEAAVAAETERAEAVPA